MPKHDDAVGLKGHVTLVLTGPNGVIKEVRKANTVTTNGKACVADQLLAAPTLVKPGWGAVGTGTPAANALGAELGARTAFSSKTRSGAVVTMAWTVPAGTSTGALTEAGTADQLALGGNFITTASYSVINKGASDTLTVTWTLTVA